MAGQTEDSQICTALLILLKISVVLSYFNESDISLIPLNTLKRTEKEQEGQVTGAMDQHQNCTSPSAGGRDLSDTWMREAAAINPQDADPSARPRF